MDTTIVDLINFGKVAAKLSDLAGGAHNSRSYLLQGGDSDRPEPLKAFQPEIRFSSQEEACAFADAVVAEFGVLNPNFGTPCGEGNRWTVRLHVDKYAAASYVMKKKG